MPVELPHRLDTILRYRGFTIVGDLVSGYAIYPQEGGERIVEFYELKDAKDWVDEFARHH